MTEKISQSDYRDSSRLLEQFSLENQALVILTGAGETLSFGSLPNSDRDNVLTTSLEVNFADRPETCTLSITAPVSPGRELTVAFLKMFPLILLLIMVISAAGAFLCSRVLVRPILEISDRCELNRQIKTDNALLRELRGQVKKLAQAVKNTIPALAAAMENLRKNLLLFCYQLRYLRKGKERLNTSLNTLRPALAQYNQLAKDIRDKTKERRSLLSEKKALSAVHVFWHRELAAKIAALTEDLEELRSEKNLLLASLAYSEEDAADKFPKDIAAMEQSLKRLEEQEQKYSAELDAALDEYAGLREQAQDVDPVQLYEARQAIRPSKEQEAENRAQEVYGEKYSPLLMFDSKKAVSRMLHEEMEQQAVRRLVRQAQKGQQTHYKRKHKEQER
ncbi:chromosome segregation ATPase [Catenibacillus scindens]|uniref:Chromosome segregation ATPase n=1 Tax=Catenibacillus scindens TaxID=673271 RepID=A0A7W8M418_9FIRM|nr:hypothetical protein [Catenibacillus scindens]MBB5263530.1 chromosome segregation ATPase [Catenibacillus scindens]